MKSLCGASAGEGGDVFHRCLLYSGQLAWRDEFSECGFLGLSMSFEHGSTVTLMREGKMELYEWPIHRQTLVWACFIEVGFAR
jgi:hypothetical protein